MIEFKGAFKKIVQEILSVMKKPKLFLPASKMLPILFLLLSASIVEAQNNKEAKDVAIQKCLILSPQNTSISFVGTHVGDDPKPRTGGFQKFDGFVLLDDKTGLPKSLKVEFEIQSIWTEFPNLTKHLMNQDFFEAMKFPSAKFKSQRIVWQSKDECTVSGMMTLHGVTKKLSFPARVYSEKDGLQIKARFSLDRSLFGMNRMLKGVEKSVSIMVHVGKPTTGPKKNEKKISFKKYFISTPAMT